MHPWIPSGTMENGVEFIYIPGIPDIPEIPGLGMFGHVLTGSWDPTMDPQTGSQNPMMIL